MKARVTNLMQAKIDAIEESLRSYEQAGKRLIVTSSFQTHSLPMLHILQRLQPGIAVVFLDTGYHFEETITFKNEVAELLSLNIGTISGNEKPKANGLYVSSPTECCDTNKVAPLHRLLRDYDVWISGVRADQTANRGTFTSVMPGPEETERYHPMLNWLSEEINAYRLEFDLPAHPLEALGYSSIGCGPCTTVPVGDLRSGRWGGTEKTECGLHLTR